MNTGWATFEEKTRAGMLHIRKQPAFWSNLPQGRSVNWTLKRHESVLKHEKNKQKHEKTMQKHGKHSKNMTKNMKNLKKTWKEPCKNMENMKKQCSSKRYNPAKTLLTIKMQGK